MSTFRREKTVCAVCGKEHEFMKIMSTNSMGYMDLDTRPPEMQRSTICYQIQLCDRCYYANTSIDYLVPGFTKDVLESEGYLAVARDVAIPSTAKAFLLAAILYENARDYRSAGSLYLKAAWIFDDCRDAERARSARLESYKMLLRSHRKDVDTSVMSVDILRRAGEFSTAKEIAEKLLETKINDFLADILKFQIKLAEAEDSKCHTVGEVVE